MQLFEKLTGFLKNTAFFDSYVRYWPEPLNDASFDVFILIMFTVIVILPEFYYSIKARALRFHLKKKNREYARIAAGSNKEKEADEDMELIDQYLKFLLVAHCIDKDIDISFEEWKEVKFGEENTDNSVKGGADKKDGEEDMFSRIRKASSAIGEKVADLNMFGIKNKKKNKEEVSEKITAIEAAGKIAAERAKKEVKMLPEKNEEQKEIAQDDDEGLDEFERILNSIKLKRSEKMLVNKRTRQDSADEKKKRKSLDAALMVKDEERNNIAHHDSDEKKIYNAKETAAKLKEKEMLRKKRRDERLQKKQAGRINQGEEEVCS